ncbi:MAG: hypothetical protein NTW03_14870 [Verrucomicrobia bacterium]|nr:hypothetical protein [Verrucomicrobiota bacterium]
MKKLIIFVPLVLIVTLLSGCATGGGGPQSEKTLDVSSHPNTGYAYSVEPPNAQEQAGVLLRFTLTKALRYRRDVIGSSTTSRAKNASMAEETYMPTEKSDVFIAKTPTGSRAMDSRGRILKFLPSTTNTFFQSVDHTGLLPDKPVKVGDTWDEHLVIKTAGRGGSYTADETVTWKYVGIAIVRSHRCVVLEGESSDKRIREGARTVTTDRTARRVVYFAPLLGGIVELVDIYNGETKSANTGSRRQVSTKSQGQNIMTLVE